MDSPSSGSTESLNMFFNSSNSAGSAGSAGDEFSQVNQEHERKMILLNSMKSYKREVSEQNATVQMTV